jgi:pimeloyl-ACP methyl ester carboxylesterase
MITLLPGGLEVAYDDAGSGAPMLFIHGWPHNRKLWAAQLSGLPMQARCLAPDLRGFGDSSATPPSSIDGYADDLAAFLAALGIDRAVVCGLSMGGYIALAMLRRHRALLRGLILVSTRATADTIEAREKRARLIQFVEDRGVEALAANQLRGMVAEATYASRPDILEALHQLMAGASAAGVIAAQRAMMERADSTDLLGEIDFPTMVVSGAEDSITPPAEMSALAAGIPHCRLEVIKGGGHVCPYERPAAFNHVTAEFLLRLERD